MKIKVTEDNAEEIQCVLLESMGKETLHTFGSFTEINNLAKYGERLLSNILRRTSRKGAKFFALSGKNAPYERNRIVTHIILERGSTCWYLTSVKRALIYTKKHGEKELVLTKEQDEEAVRNLRKKYSIIKSKIITNDNI